MLELGHLVGRADAMSARHPVNEICLTELLSSTDAAGEKAQSELLNAGIAKPADLDPDAQRRAHWEKCYGELWQLKIAFEKEHNR